MADTNSPNESNAPRKGAGRAALRMVVIPALGVGLPGNEFVILVSVGLVDTLAPDLYLRRWNIETGFEKLKSHGFNFEETRLQGTRKTEMLMAALSLSPVTQLAANQQNQNYNRAIINHHVAGHMGGWLVHGVSPPVGGLVGEGYHVTSRRLLLFIPARD